MTIVRVSVLPTPPSPSLMLTLSVRVPLSRATVRNRNALTNRCARSRVAAGTSAPRSKTHPSTITLLPVAARFAAVLCNGVSPAMSPHLWVNNLVGCFQAI